MSLESRQRDRNFLQKLWEAASYNEDDIIYWSSSGKSIIFRIDILEVHCSPDGKPTFHSKSLSSFVRLLNSYGFRKVRYSKRDLHGKPSAAIFLQYTREFFQKGRADLLSSIERRQTKPKAYNGQSKITKLMFREKVVKNKLDSVDEARKNFRKVIANSLKAYKTGDKDHFLKKSMTIERIENLCDTTNDTIVHVASRVVVMKVEKNKESNTLSLVGVPKGREKFSRLVGEWNIEPIKTYDAPPCTSKEVVVEYEEKI